MLLLVAQRREHRVVDDAVGPAAAVPAVHELGLRAVERHQIVERVTVVGRSLDTLSVRLRSELLVMLLLHKRELVQLFTTHGSLEIRHVALRRVEVRVGRAFVAGVLSLHAVRRNIVILHGALAVNLRLLGHQAWWARLHWLSVVPSKRQNN